MAEAEPREIRKLDAAVVNRIAAGEVIQRPANALKELLENSIDASATNILVTVKLGGLKYLQIVDNGTGIRKEDLAIVCERFTTSKLHTYDDLSTIATYGFRGEALASISHVSHLAIQTKTREAQFAYRAEYADGRLKAQPKLCAGTQGTQITIEDLFYNVPTRKRALNNAGEEYARMYDVISRYAVHNAHIGFALRKFGERNDLKTSSNATCKDNIRAVYGSTVAKELLEVGFTEHDLKVKAHGYVTNVNFSTKKPAFLLFINHRLVSSAALRKAVDGVYSTYLPKGSHAFIYLSLEIDPLNCDVNVHPTKHEVHFLHEDAIIDRVTSEVETTLLACNKSRVFHTQLRLPGPSGAAPTSDGGKVYDHKLVRTDAAEQTLDRFLDAAIKTRCRKVDKVQVRLLSVINLRRRVEQSYDRQLREIFAQHTFVGCVTPRQALIQHDTRLYLCHTDGLYQELFYQLLLYDFQNLDQIRWQHPLNIVQLVQIGLEVSASGYDPVSDGSPQDIAGRVQAILVEHRDMLNTYFALEIDADGNVLGVPQLLAEHVPAVSGLPTYLMRLATEVVWDAEEACFDSFARTTAQFYAAVDTGGWAGHDWPWTVENVLFPALKKYYLPQHMQLTNGNVLQIANLPDLYKVFERC